MPNEIIQPVVGMGATYSIGSDCYPYTVSRVSESGKRLWAKKDNARIVSGNNLDGSAKYEITPNPDAAEVEFSLRINGRWYRKGQDVGRGGSFILGEREYYRDPSY